MLLYFRFYGPCYDIMGWEKFVVFRKDAHMKYSEFLKENYDMMLRLFNNMRVGIWITDRDDKVLMVNDDSLKAGGLKRSQVTGKTMKELLDIGYIMESTSTRALRSGREEQVVEELGDGGCCLVNSVPIRCDGEIDLVISIERDISDIAHLKNALKEQQETTERIRDQLKNAQINMEEEPETMVANSYKMIRVKETAEHLGALDATVIILGESGTGKEVVADLIHKSSQRVGKPFIKVNCAAIPESLIESELFGYESGSFTGARKEGQAGMFEKADGGTLFLDEIGELSLAMQSKLLRVLENGEVRRIGSAESIKVDVRLITATNRNLKKEVSSGNFREDLYYRLMILPIHIPPLRERKDDIIPLSRMFLQRFNKKYGLSKELTGKAVNELVNYSWPGNVRELRNMIERLVAGGEGTKISGFQVEKCISGIQQGTDDVAELYVGKASLEEMMRDYEIEIIRDYMEQYGSMTEAAKRLGINKSTISRKLKAYSERQKKSDV